MKYLIRRLSRVADSSQYSLLRSASPRGRRHPQLSSSAFLARRATASAAVPAGHVPVYVGDEMDRFVVSAELLNHPVFVSLLNRSAQEYGYAQKGVLHIPCHVIVFERVVETLRHRSPESRELQDLIASFSADDLSLS